MIKPYNKGSISYGNFKHHKNFVTSGKEQAKMNYRNWWDLGKWMLIQIVCVCKTALRIFISKKAVCWTVLEKNAIAFIFFLTLKSLTIWGKTIINTTKKKLFRVSDLDTKADAYTMANWVHSLINYTGGRNKEI